MAVKFFSPTTAFEMHIKKIGEATTYLVVDIGGDKRRKSTFLLESRFRLYTQTPQRKINQERTFIKYTFASLSFVKIFNK